MPQLARRMSRAKPSAIMAVAEKAKRLKAEGRDIISFSIGVPNFLPGPHVYAAARVFTGWSLIRSNGLPRSYKFQFNPSQHDTDPKEFTFPIYSTRLTATPNRVPGRSAAQGMQDGIDLINALAYHPENNYLGLKHHTTGLDDLRHIATARLVLDNIPHVKAYWVMITPKLAQVALSFGADDLDGTVVRETIYHMAGAETAQMMPIPELERVVREAGFVPVERDTLYNPIARVG